MNWFSGKNKKGIYRALLMISSLMFVLCTAQMPNVASEPKISLEKQLPTPALFKSQGKTSKPSKSAAKQTPKSPKKSSQPTKESDTTKVKPDEPLFPILRQPEEIRGVWLTNNDMTVLKDRRKLQATMDKLKRLKFNTVYPVIWNSGYVTYPSRVAQKAGIQPFVYRGNEGQDIVADVLAQGRRQGMLVIPWFEFGFMAPMTSELAMNHPNWLTQQRNGVKTSVGAAGEVAWLNPFRPEVQKFITNLVVEAVTQYDVDGIQFDDHMSLPYKFGYDPYTVALYKQEKKKNPPANPKDPEWTKWRADKITDFMVQLKREVRKRKPNAIISVSPNYAAYAYKFQLQDWATWVKKGVVDELIVQVYRSNLNSFKRKLLLPEMREAQQKIPTAVGILTGLRRRPIDMGQIQKQVFIANNRGMGTVFFYLESLWNEGPESPKDRFSGLQYLFPRSATRARS